MPRQISQKTASQKKKSSSSEEIQKPSAEIFYQEELNKLAKEDKKLPRPKGWFLTPQSVLKFILGDEEAGADPKFVGERSTIERCIVALATNRGLMLIGEPGTAKSYLSELLAAAISGDSTLIVQGSAGTSEDNIKYSWNYALLLAEGPSAKSLVPAPVYRGMNEGKLVRFEEITRCPLEIQDILLSVLSDRVMSIPELPDESRTLYAKNGFNVIATANTRDRGINEMSAALKRRFNFETISPIQNLSEEISLVQRETARLLERAEIPVSLPPEMAKILVTTFHELRQGKTGDGKSLDPLSSVMSTAEAVSVSYAAGIHSYYYGKEKGEKKEKKIEAEHLVQNLVGSAIKDNPDDLKKLRHYFNHIVKKRKGKAWEEYYQAKNHLL